MGTRRTYAIPRRSQLRSTRRPTHDLRTIEVLEYNPLGRGSILFVNGGSGARPNPNVAGTSIAFAGEGAYAKMLHDTLADDGIQVAQLIFPSAIEPGHPTNDPGVLADKLWHLHTAHDEFRIFAEPMSTNG